MMITSRNALVAAALLLAAFSAPRTALAGSFDGKEPPALAATEWLNTKDGKPVTLNALRGKAVVVEFWATWCPPCRATIPHLVELYKKHAKDGLFIASIHSKRGAEKKDEIVSFAKENGMEYAIGLDTTGATGAAYKVEGIPHAFVLDAKGVCIWEGHPADGGFETAVAEALKGAKPDVRVGKRDGGSGALDPAWRSIERGDWKDAIDRLKKLAKSAKEPKDREVAEGYLGDIDAVGKEGIARAEALLADKAYGEAAALLDETADRFKGVDAAKEAEAKLKEWKKEKTVKAEIEGAADFAQAQKLDSSGHSAEAAAGYKRVVSKWKGTAAAAKAEARLKELAAATGK